jgi:hypothetical protein
MHVVVRTYSGQGASEVFDLIAEREGDVRDLITGVPGFVSYSAVRSNGGGVTVTICEDKDGTDESTRRAAGFVADNLTSSADPPEITEGDTVLHFGS